MSCKEASQKLKKAVEQIEVPALLRLSSIVFPNIYSKSKPQAGQKLEDSVVGVNDYFLKSSKSAINTLNQTMLINAFLDGMDKRAKLSNTENTFAKSKAKLHTRESWKVIGSNAPTYVLMLKITIEGILYSLFPIIVLMIFIGLFSASILIDYVKALFALSLISPIFAIINRLSYGLTSIRINSLLEDTVGGNNFTFANIYQIHDLNADIMAFAGYLSIMSIPLAFQLVQRGSLAIGNMLSSNVSSNVQGNSNQIANEVVSGNYSLGNVSMGNDSLFNSSKNNISESNLSKYNDSSNNISRSNESINNLSNSNRSIDNTSIDNKSLNNLSKDTINEKVVSRNNTNENKHDTSTNIVKEGTETYTDRGVGTFTFGGDGKILSMQQERTTLENSISSSQGVVNSDNERVGLSYGFELGGKRTTAGSNNWLGKVASAVGLHGGGSQQAASDTTHSSSTHLTNNQAYTKETIEHLNSKYDKEYIKGHMEAVFKEANEFQASLVNVREVESTTTAYTHAKHALMPLTSKKQADLSKELDEFAESGKK